MENTHNPKELKVSAIENGTVIDHIPENNVFQVIRILGLDNVDNQMLFGTNLESQKYGKKGIVKVNNLFFAPEEINKIALVAPTATLIVIRDFAVVAKNSVTIPDEVHKIVKCFNPNCITNHESIPTRFDVVNKEDVKLLCHYCEKVTGKETMTFI
ncbi:MAG: aspartate carbamoyltransferase regulatory subunit [Bacteroidota bacterium]